MTNIFQVSYFANLYHESLGEWNNKKNMRNEENIDHIVCHKRAITSSSLTCKIFSLDRPLIKRNRNAEINLVFFN